MLRNLQPHLLPSPNHSLPSACGPLPKYPADLPAQAVGSQAVRVCLGLRVTKILGHVGLGGCMPSPSEAWSSRDVKVVGKSLGLKRHNDCGALIF